MTHDRLSDDSDCEKDIPIVLHWSSIKNKLHRVKYK